MVLRPTVNDLETPDVSAFVEFVTDGAGEWTGLRPDPITNVTAEARSGGVIRLRWRHEIIKGATPDDFEITYSTDATATGTSTTETYTAAGIEYTKDITLSDGVQYFFKVFARTSGLASTPRGTLGIFADASAPAAPVITTATTWQS